MIDQCFVPAIVSKLFSEACAFQNQYLALCSFQLGQSVSEKGALPLQRLFFP